MSVLTADEACSLFQTRTHHIVDFNGTMNFLNQEIKNAAPFTHRVEVNLIASYPDQQHVLRKVIQTLRTPAYDYQVGVVYGTGDGSVLDIRWG